jgi:uroporphyrinogen decarboxylase
VNNRERTLAILSYESYDRLPLVHFGFWRETLQKWAAEGHITWEEAETWYDGNRVDVVVTEKLGFDFNWNRCFSPNTRLFPPFEEQVLEEFPDGSRKVLNEDGAVVIEKEGVTSIPKEVDHLLKGRKEWEEVFLPRLQFAEERITGANVNAGEEELLFNGEGVALHRAAPFTSSGLDYLRRGEWKDPYGLHCGSLYGVIRNWLGLVGSSYLQVDDPALFDEMIETVGELCYQCTKRILEAGATFDFGHFWEDICFRGGPLINPDVFREKVGPHYKRITDLLRSHGVHIVSLDCDGKIDALVPIWLENGVNTMFPIEVGVWDASIRPWREKYGRGLLGVGGVDKRVFARDYAAVDAEVERLRPLVELGGYIPCPDHRIPVDGKWENIQYYCDRMRSLR